MPKEILLTQPAQKRIKNFSEVALGFTKKQATSEALRCPQPTDPAHAQRCLLGIDILAFIRLIREGNVVGALQKIREQNPLAAVCGRVCSAPCETDAFHGDDWQIGIRALERFATDQGEKKNAKGVSSAKEQAIAVVGSGPSGLTAAADLAKRGYRVTIFEALHAPGGSLRFSIPEFRLPRKVLDAEIEYIKSLGVAIKTDSLIGQTFSLKELFEMGYAAVYLATGINIPQLPGLPGGNLSRVYTASEFLLRVNLMNAHLSPQYATPLPIGQRIVVVGGNDEVLDCARISRRLGKDVMVIFERTEEDLMAHKDEVAYAKEEGVKFELFTRPLEILPKDNKSVRGLKCIRLDFADPNSSGQWQLVAVEGSELILEADTVIMATPYKANALIGKLTEGLKVKKDGTFSVDKDTFMTSLAGVFASGDSLSATSSIVEAMSLAKKTARAIDQYLTKPLTKK